ncbi:MAG: class E sortase [Micromonosporaceae bacterium]|nr:class E sortase [Micromonosporaceae bacterium]
MADSETSEGADQPTVAPNGELVVPLRPVRTEEGYRSVYSHMTRRTIWTVLRTTTRTTGEFMITFGMIVLLFAAYEVWGVGAAVSAYQDDLNDQLNQAWSPQPSASASASASAGPPIEGKAIARLYIPRMRQDPWTVVEGVKPADIRYAPGHYPTTVLPGQVGNFSIAGHRTLKIFWDLDKLKSGDLIVVETREAWFTYKVTQSHVVSPKAVSVIAPVPNKPGVKATQAMVTLTTCNPKTQNYQRLVVHGALAGRQAHDAGPPAGVKI